MTDRYVVAPRWAQRLLRHYRLVAIVMPWGRCYCLPGWTTHTQLRTHEDVHFAQIARLGPIRFSILYLYYLARYGYRASPLEQEAYAASGDLADG